MQYIPRKIIPPDSSFFLLGPRGTGKSTWLLHHYPEAQCLFLALTNRQDY